MSLEAKIEALTEAVSTLTATIKSGASTETVQPTPASATAATPTQKRGRPSNAEKAAAAAAAAAKVEPVVEDDGSFLDEPAEEPVPEYTLDQVRAAIVGYQKFTSSQDKARKLLKEVGGVEVLSALPKEKFASVITAANKR